MRKAHPPFVFPLSDFARSSRFFHERIMNMRGEKYECFMNLQKEKNEKCGYSLRASTASVYTLATFSNFPGMENWRTLRGESPKTPYETENLKGGKNVIPNRHRKVEILFFLSESENKLLQENMKKAGIKNKSAYIRKMILDGYIIHQDYGVLKECVAALGRIGNNLNQLAKVANTYHDINIPELTRMADEVSEWRLRFLRELK